MPARNTIKVNVKDGYYHVYNRGVEKRTIFQDSEDHKVFLNCLKEALSKPIKPNSKTVTLNGSTFKGIPKSVKNFHGSIDLVAYCLMPNHFHLLIKQKERGAMKSFMQSILTRYVLYFNKKYQRVGSLFQGIYKAALITKDSYLLHLSRYIHLNPEDNGHDLTKAYSSYADYLKLQTQHWIKPDIILNNFKPLEIPFHKHVNNYKDFVEDYSVDSKKLLGKLILEDT